MTGKILNALKKFALDLKGRVVLTEAATGNYVVTPIIAAAAGAKVYAYARNSRYGAIKEVLVQSGALAEQMGVRDGIEFITDIDTVNLKKVDIVTNCGFLRPIGEALIGKLSSRCVIPLMYEPWEFRKSDVDIEACIKHGIKIYGTNEDDARLRTVDYLGYVILYFLLEKKISPFSGKVLVLGNERFVAPVEFVLKRNGYDLHVVTDYENETGLRNKISIKDFDAIAILEHERDLCLIGEENAFLKKNTINEEAFVIHICGNVDFNGVRFSYTPENPSKFGYMSYTTDFIDSQAVIDLHTAGLKVAEGMLTAYELGLEGKIYKDYMESNYPALAFKNEALW